MGCCQSDEYKFKTIADNYHSIAEVQQAMIKAGLESSNLIFGIDYTKSNLYTGEKTFGGKSLHDVTVKNPYMQVIEIVGKTLERFDDDRIIPTFGFGDVYTTNKSVFPFYPDRQCVGFEEVLQRYIEITPRMLLSGPTNFAPLINASIDIIKKTQSYHILVIVTDGQVTNERDTRDAIVRATNYPLSIICIGVGDGPWEAMYEFDDKLPQRKFDNFQFVEFHKLQTRHPDNFEAAFALAAMMEVPDQYNAIKRLGLLDPTTN